MTWKVLVAFSVASGSSRNKDGGRGITFCDVDLDSLGAFPGSSLSVMSPPTVSSFARGDCEALCIFAGEPEYDREMEIRGEAMPFAGAERSCPSSFTEILSSASCDCPSSIFMALTSDSSRASSFEEWGVALPDMVVEVR